MSDGEHDATLDRGRGSGAASDDQPIAPTLGAAPWERFSAPSPDDGAHRWQVEPRVEHEEPDAEKGGCHADGAVSVADLIAKIGAPTPDRPRHHHISDEVAPDAEPAEPSGVGSDVPVDLQDTQVIDTPAYSLEVVSELPDLDAANYPDDPNSNADSESDRTTSRRARPMRFRRTSPPQDPGPKPNGRRPMLLAARSVAALFAVLALVLTGGAWQWSTSKNNRLNTISALDPNSRDIVDPEWAVRRRGLLDRRDGLPRRGQCQYGRRRHRGRRRHTVGHRDAGQHSGEPQTRGGGVVPPRPGDHPDPVRGLEPRDRQVRTPLRPEDRRRGVPGWSTPRPN